MILDFELSKGKDLIFENNKIKETTDYKTLIKNILYTEGEFDNKKGYWLEIDDSQTWLLNMIRYSKNDNHEYKIKKILESIKKELNKKYNILIKYKIDLDESNIEIVYKGGSIKI